MAFPTATITGRPNQIAVLSGEPYDAQGGTPNDEDAAQAPSAEGAPQAKGFWLDEPDETLVAKDIEVKILAQEPRMKNLEARWSVNLARRDGDVYTKLVKDVDTDTYRVYVPMGMENTPPSLNNTDKLCSKYVATLLTDPPQPDAEPEKDDAQERDAAEFSTRALKVEFSESGLNMERKLAQAEELACSYGSGFMHYYLDPQAGGRQPKEIMASMAATTVDDALYIEQPDPMDPTQMVRVPQPEPYVIRYIMPDQVTLTDEPADADYEWLPKVCCAVYSGKHIRFLTPGAMGVDESRTVALLDIVSVDRLRQLYPEVMATLAPEEVKKLIGYTMNGIKKRLLPKWLKTDQGTVVPGRDSDGVPGDALVLVTTVYQAETGDYPEGAMVVMAGGKIILSRTTWTCPRVNPKSGKECHETMDIPIVQVPQFMDPRQENPYGIGLVDRVGDGDTIIALGFARAIEIMQFKPHLFVPIGSGVHEHNLSLPTGTPIPYNPANGGIPVYQPEPQQPSFAMEVVDRVNQMQNSVSGLEDTAQGVDSPNSKSGLAKQVVIEQAQVALSISNQYKNAAFQRSCRMVLQFMRKGYKQPRRMKVVGADGSYKEREWTSVDLGSTRDVRIAAGTSTMLSRSTKQSLARDELLQAINALGAGMNVGDAYERYRGAVAGNVDPILGLEDDPFRMQVKGQIERFFAGPPEGWAPVMPVPQMDEMGMVQEVPQFDPANPFGNPLPVQDEPTVALVRHMELAKAMAQEKFLTKPPEWQQHLLAEYERARFAAGVVTRQEQYVMEQQAAAQGAAVAEDDGAAESSEQSNT